jgi:hypothetical protein
MPQINRIRINNVKYNFGTQFYDDFMMRFNCRSAIYDLANGGGKSLLMLLLLQNVIPNCTLDEKQPIEKLFRAGSGNTVIHSLVEWKLDACFQKDNYKYMTTGFCARKAKGNQNDADGTADGETSVSDDMASIEYFNYCIFYREFGDNDIKNLPLDSNGERITYNGLKAYLRDLEKKDFNVSVKIFERKGEYQQFISKFGLYESEWEIIRGINKTEGHVRTYFETHYKTSRKVVEDLLIEEIIQKSFHNRLAVENDEDIMAQTLLDIKDKLVQLSKKQSQLNNYDGQIEVIKDFAEYVSDYAHLYEEKDRLKQQLLEMLLACKKELYYYRQNEGRQLEQKEKFLEEQRQEQKLVLSAKVIEEQQSLAGIKELISANENSRDMALLKMQQLQKKLDLAEAAQEYTEYREYDRLLKEVNSALWADTKDSGEIMARLTQTATAIYLLNEKENEQINGQISVLEEQLKAALKQAEFNNEQYQKKEKEIVKMQNLSEYTKQTLADLESEISSLMEQTGLLVIENAKKELEREKELDSERHLRLAGTQREYEQTSERIPQLQEKQAELRAHRELMAGQLEELKTALSRQAQIKEMLDKILSVYGEHNSAQAKTAILENYKRLEAECIELENQKTKLEQFIENTKKGIFDSATDTKNKLKEYLSYSYPGEVLEGSEWLRTLSDSDREEVLKAVPFAGKLIVFIGDFQKIRHDEVIKDFGGSEEVIPILSAIIIEEKLKSGSLKREVKDFGLAFAAKDLTFLEDENRRLMAVKKTEEELEHINLKLLKLTDRRDVIFDDYVRVNNLESGLDSDLSEKVQVAQQRVDDENEQLGKIAGQIETMYELQRELSKKLADDEYMAQEAAKKISLLERLVQQEKQQKDIYEKLKEYSDTIIKLQKEVSQEKSECDIMQEKCQKLNREIRTGNERLEEIRKSRSVYQQYFDEKLSDDESVQRLTDKGADELASTFSGLKAALDREHSNVGDKETLANTYRLAMEKCARRISQKGFTIEFLEENKDAGISEEEQEKIRQELESLGKENAHLSDELASQLALMNRLEGSIAHGISRIEEQFGSFESFRCDNTQQFLQQHEKQRESLNEKLAALEKEIQQAEKNMRDMLLIEKDLTRIVEKAELPIPEYQEGMSIAKADLSEYEAVQKAYEKQLKLEMRRLDEFAKKRDKLAESLEKLEAGELASQVRFSVNSPLNAEQTKELVERLNETNTLIALEKTRVSKGIEDMEQIKENFEIRCIQTCCNIKSELDRLPKLSCITMDNETIEIVGLKIPYVKEEAYRANMASYIDETVTVAESFKDSQERLKYIRNRLTWKRLFSVIVTDMNSIRVHLYKRERIKDQSRYLRYEEAVGSTGQSQGIYIQFLIAIINYISSINADPSKQPLIGKTVFIDNPFGAAKDIYIWEPIFALLKTNHVQLIVPARGATPAITGRFDVNYVLGQKLADGRQQTVVVDYYSKAKNESVEYVRFDYEQEEFRFV